MSRTDTQLERWKAALESGLPGRAAQEQMTGRVRPMPDQVPDNARPSAVLCLLIDEGEGPDVVLIRRTEDGRPHSGQISFPGGRRDPEDIDLEDTALREAYEETGIRREQVRLAGALTPLYIPVSNFMVHPFVGLSATVPEFVLSEREVQYVMQVPLCDLFAEGNKETRTIRPVSAPELELRVPVYNLPGGHYIWGATAMILSELEAIWKQQIAANSAGKL